MAVNKVTFGGETLIDLTADTVTADTLAKGVTAHDASGAEIVGTLAASAQKVVAGTYNAIYGSDTVSITHRLGTTPNFAILYQTSTYASKNGPDVVIVHAKRHNDSSMNSMQVYNPGSDMGTESKNTVTMDETTVTFGHGNNSSYSSTMYNGNYGYIIGVI